MTRDFRYPEHEQAYLQTFKRVYEHEDVILPLKRKADVYLMRSQVYTLQKKIREHYMVRPDEAEESLRWVDSVGVRIKVDVAPYHIHFYNRQKTEGLLALKDMLHKVGAEQAYDPIDAGALQALERLQKMGIGSDAPAELPPDVPRDGPIPVNTYYKRER